jgi:large subunit ribosomal protein L18
VKTQAKKAASTKRDKKRMRIRKNISGTQEKPRLSVFRSDKHIYAQLISDVSGKTLASASTLEDEVEKAVAAAKAEGPSSTKSVHAARQVGLLLGQRAKAAAVAKVVFDRNGFLYSGRIKAVADGAREAGLDF